MVTSAIERSAYINEIHSKTGVATEAIIEDFKLYEKNNPSKQENVVTLRQETAPHESRRANLEKKLFGVIFWQSQNGKNLDSLTSDFIENIGKEDFEAMYSAYEPFAQALAFEAETWYNSEAKTLDRDITEILLSLEEEVLGERKLSLLTEISKRESSTDATDLKPILEQYQNILNRIELIKNKRRSEQ
jgi:hypothetical protein